MEAALIAIIVVPTWYQNIKGKRGKERKGRGDPLQ
jgi:hypothetical protein